MTKKVLQEKTIRDIISIHGELSSAKNLTPSPLINGEFSKLVHIVNVTTSHSSREILGNAKIASILKDIRTLSSKGESELELFWAKKVLASDIPEAILAQFPYYENYEKMTEFEVRGMRSCDLHKNHKILFVGSGPLPLSSIMMARQHGFSVDNLDIDSNAVDVSRKIISAIGLSENVKVVKGNIFSMKDFVKYKGIFIAALVGKDEAEKIKIVSHISNQSEKGTHVILRSVSDLGTLLYPNIRVDTLKGINVLKKYDRPKGIINNIIVGKTK